MEGAQTQQDFPLEPVPAEARRSGASLYFVLLGFTFFTATMFAGGKVGLAFSFSNLVLVVLVANLLLAGYASVLALIACESGLSTSLMARFAFGNWGSRWCDFLLGFTQVGWYAWGTGTVTDLAIELAGFSPDYRLLWMIFFGAFFCLTAYIGYRGLDLLARVTVPLMTLLLVWSAFQAVGDAGGWGAFLSLPSSAEMSWSTAVTIIVGTFVSGATQSTNWTRFAATRASAVGATLVAFLLGNGLMVMAGAFAVNVYEQPDIVRVLVQQGALVFALLMLFGNIWTTQDNTIYNFSVAGCSFFRTPRRRLITVVGAALGTVLALLGFADRLVDFLLLLGTAIPPLGGVIAADYFLVHRGRYPQLSTHATRLCYSGLAAYGVGVGAASFLPLAPVAGVVAAFFAHTLFNYGRATS